VQDQPLAEPGPWVLVGEPDGPHLARTKWKGADRREDDLVVEMGDGSAWRPDSWSRKWATLADGVEGLEDITFHMARHGFGTLHFLAGTDPKVVSELMGHSSTRVTQEIYQHVVPKLREDAAERLDRLIGGAQGVSGDQIGDHLPPS
jgi:integrase